MLKVHQGHALPSGIRGVSFSAMSLERLIGHALRGFGDAWHYRDAQYLSCEVSVDRASAHRWVPAPLRLTEPATATIFTAFFPNNLLGSVYREAGLFLHVEHRKTRALFCPWMIVDDDVALVLGRELLGYPKKLGTIRFHQEGDRIVAAASRRDQSILRMEGVLGAPLSDAPPFLGRPHRNVAVGLGLGLPRLLAFTPRERPIEVRSVDLTLVVSDAPRDPISALGIGVVRRAYFHRVDLGGRVPPIPLARVSPLWLIDNLSLRVH